MAGNGVRSNVHGGAGLKVSVLVHTSPHPGGNGLVSEESCDVLPRRTDGCSFFADVVKATHAAACF